MRLRQEKKLDRNEMIQLLETANREDREFLAAQAREVREKIYGKDVFVRGLIEFTNPRILGRASPTPGTS